MQNYDRNHYVYFDLVDEWLSSSEFPFLFDWKLNDDGTFRMFYKEEVLAQRAIGVQRIP